jgi:hypothetical protein
MRPPLATGVTDARWIFAPLLLAALAGCSTWQASTSTPQEILPPETQETVRLTLNDGAVITLLNATMENGGIVGSQQGFGLEEGVRVAVDDIRSIEVRRTNVWGTAVLTAGIAAGVVLTGRKLRDEVSGAR